MNLKRDYNMNGRICGGYLANGSPVGTGKIHRCSYWGQFIWQDSDDESCREWVIMGTRLNGHDVIVQDIQEIQ